MYHSPSHSGNSRSSSSPSCSSIAEAWFSTSLLESFFSESIHSFSLALKFTFYWRWIFRALCSSLTDETYIISNTNHDCHTYTTPCSLSPLRPLFSMSGEKPISSWLGGQMNSNLAVILKLLFVTLPSDFKQNPSKNDSIVSGKICEIGTFKNKINLTHFYR